MDYLSIIAAKLGSNDNSDSNRILPDGNLVNPNLKYKSDTGEEIVISGLGGTSRIATISDLKYLLNNRFYNSDPPRFVLWNRLGIRNNPVPFTKLKILFTPQVYSGWKDSYAYYGKTKSPGEDPKNEFPAVKCEIPPGVSVIAGNYINDRDTCCINRVYVEHSDGNIDERIETFPVEIAPGQVVTLAKLIEYQYNLIMKAKEVSNLEETQGQSYQYNVKAIIDLLNETTVLDLIKLDSGSYTNIVDLTQLPKTKTGEISSIVKIGVQYSKKKEDEVEIRVYSQDLSFSPFEKHIENQNNTEEVLTYKNFQEMINSDVAMECTNGVIRVFPNSQEVIECIISYCYVIYGKL